MTNSVEIPHGSAPLSAYQGARIQGVSVWLLDLKNKRMMLTRSTNVESLMLRMKRYVQDNASVRLGERIMQFLAASNKNEHGVYWIKNGFVTHSYLTSIGFVELARFANPSALPSKKVMIKGKVLQIKHLKTDFTLICAAEPRNLKKVLVSRLTRAIASVNPKDWEDANNVKCFLERFTKKIIEEKGKDKKFVTAIVDMPANASHMSYTRIKNDALTRQWLQLKGFKPKPNRFQKEYTNVDDQKDSSHRFALGH